MRIALYTICFVGFISFAIFQVYIGFIGIEHHLGAVAAFASVALIFLMKITLPITIGAFFGAIEFLGWHWSIALLFASPGLVFVIPSIIAMITSFVTNLFICRPEKDDVIEGEYEILDEKS